MLVAAQVRATLPAREQRMAGPRDWQAILGSQAPPARHAQPARTCVLRDLRVDQHHVQVWSLVRLPAAGDGYAPVVLLLALCCVLPRCRRRCCRSSLLLLPPPLPPPGRHARRVCMCCVPGPRAVHGVDAALPHPTEACWRA